MKKIVNALLVIILVVSVGILIKPNFPTTEPIETETEVSELVTETETETEIVFDEITTPIPVIVGVDEYEDDYYIFCSVEEIKSDTFVVRLPNGELEEFYMLSDPPIDDNGNPMFTIVVFKVAKHECYDFDKWVAFSVN